MKWVVNSATQRGDFHKLFHIANAYSGILGVRLNVVEGQGLEALQQRQSLFQQHTKCRVEIDYDADAHKTNKIETLGATQVLNMDENRLDQLLNEGACTTPSLDRLLCSQRCVDKQLALYELVVKGWNKDITSKATMLKKILDGNKVVVIWMNRLGGTSAQSKAREKRHQMSKTLAMLIAKGAINSDPRQRVIFAGDRWDEPTGLPPLRTNPD